MTALDTKALLTGVTPGDWHYQEDSDAYTHIVRAGERRFVCQLPQNTSGISEANARLIAEAPRLARRVIELEEALGALIALWDGYQDSDLSQMNAHDCLVDYGAWEKANAALKGEGDE